MVEHRTENPGVRSSILRPGIFFLNTLLSLPDKPLLSFPGLTRESSLFRVILWFAVVLSYMSKGSGNQGIQTKSSCHCPTSPYACPVKRSCTGSLPDKPLLSFSGLTRESSLFRVILWLAVVLSYMSKGSGGSGNPITWIIRLLFERAQRLSAMSCRGSREHPGIF